MLHSYKLVIPIPKKKWKGSGPPTKLVNCSTSFFSTTVVGCDVPCAEYVIDSITYGIRPITTKSAN